MMPATCGPRAENGTVDGSPPSRSVRRRPSPVRIPTWRRSRLGDQESALPGRQSDHRGAIVEPAAQMPPFPVAQVHRGRVELARGVDHVVRGDRRGRGGQPGAVSLERRLALSRRAPPAHSARPDRVARLIPAISRSPHPGHRPMRRTGGRAKAPPAAGAGTPGQAVRPIPPAGAATCFPSRNRSRSSASAKALG